MHELEKALFKLVVPVVSDSGLKLVELGNSMVADNGDEMDKYGLQLVQIGNHIADWCDQVVTLIDSNGSKELHAKYEELVAVWNEEHPDVPFLRPHTLEQ